LQHSQELPREYKEYQDIFSKEKANELPPQGQLEHTIELTEDLPHRPIYNLSEKELKVLHEYIQDGLNHGWIRESTSSAGMPILFTPKKDGELRLCVDYRALNQITVKNRYLLLLIGKILDRLSGARYYTKLDLHNAYYRVCICKRDKWKTAFRTRYGHFEYLVMPMGLSNVPATFQTYINRALVGLVDITCIVYLDNILIYSEDLVTYKYHIAEVLECL
jgi:Reverse transcriptase (RNA-dependent DNA polymerase)